MQTVFCNLMAASLFIHALLGCCWHHAHAQSCCSKQETKVSERVTGCSHGHSCGHSADKSHQKQKPAEPHQHKDCPGSCTFLSVAKTQVDCHSPLSPLPFAAFVPFVAEVGATFHVSADRVTDESGPPPPLRLHLLNQILLI